MQRKGPTSIRLTDNARQLRDALAEKLGISGAGVIELAIRELAERKGVTIDPKKTKK